MVPVLFSRVVLKLMKWLMSQYLLTCIATQKTNKQKKGLCEIQVERDRSVNVSVTINQGIGSHN